MNTRQAKPDTKAELGAFLSIEDLRTAARRGDIRTVMVGVPDMQGRLKGKRLGALGVVETLDTDPDAPVAEACAYILTTNIDMDPLTGFSLTDWTDGFQDIRVRADWDTLRRLSYLPHIAVALGDAVHSDGSPVMVAPRQMLNKQLDHLAALGYQPEIGLESEFLLYKDGRPVEAHNMDYALDHSPPLGDFFRHLEDALHDSGIRVLAVKTEGQPGQIEVTFPHGPALDACDNYVLYKQTVKHLAQRHGMTVSFMAAPFTDVGSGLHLHLSLLRDGQPVYATSSARDLPTDTMQHSIAGLLSAMPHLAVLYAPNWNSYKRYAPYSFAPRFMNWGIDNRGTAIRVTGHGRGTHLEVRLAGADANPYLITAASLASLVHGLSDKLLPPGPCLGDAYADRKSVPVRQDLPSALAYFESSSLVHTLLGVEVVQHYTRAARAEIDAHRHQVTDVERERFERA